ncbi:mucin-2-like [Brachyhypopomus gauderio]|uniref:mucin-2-like n=1 Tax=Brachyhypopomus gauderio TaxID=698409 RepID=UPI0040421384
MGTINLIPTQLLIWVTLSIGLVTAQTKVSVCSTWGNYQFKTFDGDMFQLVSACNHILTSQCKSSYEGFNIQLRRQTQNDKTIIVMVTLKLEGTVVELTSSTINVNGETITAPFLASGVSIEKTSYYITVRSTVGLVALWNQDDAFMVELDAKYINQTCGLCGDFNGLPIISEFMKDGAVLSASDYGNLWKMDGPTETCQEQARVDNGNCGDKSLQDFCNRLFFSDPLSSCSAVVSVQSFLDICMEDLCQCNTTGSSCLCQTVAEYSRECAHEGGIPGNWRTADFCPMSCPTSMVYMECGSPCTDTCSNSERGQVCAQHCIDGCFCPPGTVYDDVKKTGCIPLSDCSCTHGGNVYAPGESYTASCSICTCNGGQWTCANKDCPATCSVQGGAHIITYDGKPYTYHGNCEYVLSRVNTGTTVVGELLKCGITDSETCLKTVTLALSKSNFIKVYSNGKVEVNRILTQLPLSTSDVSIFKPSTFYIILHSHKIGLQLRVQLVPIMQVFITMNTQFQGQTSGLCGTFNNIQSDDFTTPEGLIEGTSVHFGNSWQKRACSTIDKSFENPCSLSTENEKYAQHWCSLLTDPSGVFSLCHSEINPEIYKSNCIYDTCNCEKTEDCMCAALSTYVHACADKGIHLKGWRKAACQSYSASCPSTMVYSYNMTSCDRTCQSLSQTDFICTMSFVPVDGCGCEEGTYLNDNGICVPPSSCPCYDSNTVVQAGESISKDGTTCMCKQGRLNCIGELKTQVCVAPMTFFNCSTSPPETIGSECQKSCRTLDMACISTQCVSGCVCPSGLVSDGEGGCITEDRCPCVHNGVNYAPGDSVKVDCNLCTCKDRKWQCTTNQCSGTCSVYGDGHYTTFDDQKYVFNGNCQYTLAQDYCSSSNGNGTFRIITENIPCGTTGTTCSKAIDIFLGSNEIILSDGTYQVVQKNTGEDIPFQIRTMGIYMVIEVSNGLILIWDRKTSIYIKLSPDFNGNVCGLCGNYDGNANNDFTTRSQEVVVDAVRFGNSWKVSPTCPKAMDIQNPCAHNPYREAWAQKQCSIINSNVFSACHAQVDPANYYAACVRDACACDTGGDCECFCTAVSAYAEACNAAGVCVQWRTPKICPLFCDYYNYAGGCNWHYQPCGAPCMKTCRNPNGNCSAILPALEGCYPNCPAELPFFDEDKMKCVAHDQCGCYVGMQHYDIGETIPSMNNCETCLCTTNGKNCSHDVHACMCDYNNTMYHFGDIIYYTTDGIGGCIKAVCSDNGKIERALTPCETTVSPTTLTTMTTTPVPTTVFVFTTPETTEKSPTPPETTILKTTTSTTGPATSPTGPTEQTPTGTSGQSSTITKSTVIPETTAGASSTTVEKPPTETTAAATTVATTGTTVPATTPSGPTESSSPTTGSTPGGSTSSQTSTVTATTPRPETSGVSSTTTVLPETKATSPAAAETSQSVGQTTQSSTAPEKSTTQTPTGTSGQSSTITKSTVIPETTAGASSTTVEKPPTETTAAATTVATTGTTVPATTPSGPTESSSPSTGSTPGGSTSSQTSTVTATTPRPETSGVSSTTTVLPETKATSPAAAETSQSVGQTTQSSTAPEKSTTQTPTGTSGQSSTITKSTVIPETTAGASSTTVEKPPTETTAAATTVATTGTTVPATTPSGPTESSSPTTGSTPGGSTSSQPSTVTATTPRPETSGVSSTTTVLPETKATSPAAAETSQSVGQTTQSSTAPEKSTTQTPTGTSGQSSTITKSTVIPETTAGASSTTVEKPPTETTAAATTVATTGTTVPATTPSGPTESSSPTTGSTPGGSTSSQPSTVTATTPRPETSGVSSTTTVLPETKATSPAAAETSQSVGQTTQSSTAPEKSTTQTPTGTSGQSSTITKSTVIPETTAGASSTTVEKPPTETTAAATTVATTGTTVPATTPSGPTESSSPTTGSTPGGSTSSQPSTVTATTPRPETSGVSSTTTVLPETKATSPAAAETSQSVGQTTQSSTAPEKSTTQTPTGTSGQSSTITKSTVIPETTAGASSTTVEKPPTETTAAATTVATTGTTVPATTPSGPTESSSPTTGSTPGGSTSSQPSTVTATTPRPETSGVSSTTTVLPETKATSPAAAETSQSVGQTTQSSTAPEKSTTQTPTGTSGQSSTITKSTVIPETTAGASSTTVEKPPTETTAAATTVATTGTTVPATTPSGPTESSSPTTGSTPGGSTSSQPSTVTATTPRPETSGVSSTKTVLPETKATSPAAAETSQSVGQTTQSSTAPEKSTTQTPTGTSGQSSTITKSTVIPETTAGASSTTVEKPPTETTAAATTVATTGTTVPATTPSGPTESSSPTTGSTPDSNRNFWSVFHHHQIYCNTRNNSWSFIHYSRKTTNRDHCCSHNRSHYWYYCASHNSLRTN